MEILVLALVAVAIGFEVFVYIKMPKGLEASDILKIASAVSNEASKESLAIRQELGPKLDSLKDSLVAMLSEAADKQQRLLFDNYKAIAFELERAANRSSQAFEEQKAIAAASKEANEKAILALSEASTSILFKIQGAMADKLSEFIESERLLASSNAQGLEQIRNKLDEKLDKLRSEMSAALSEMRGSNEKKLEEMRATVDEKLQKTLDSRLQKSFEAVSGQLESVNKGLGEMKSVAESVGSLNRVLSNAKARGVLGELQLGQIIEDMLPPHLYEKEVCTAAGSSERVEYAIKLPGLEDGGTVWLPIDSKFPLEDYYRLLDGYEKADKAMIESSRKALLARIKAFAGDIKKKYISPPDTTDFAILFVPTEGLYSELVRDPSFIEGLRKIGILPAGPTSLSALISSLQVGFKTLQIQKASAEIERTLGAAKREFEAFEGILSKAREKIAQAGSEIEKLVGPRTKAINRTLRNVQVYIGEDSQKLLGIDGAV